MYQHFADLGTLASIWLSQSTMRQKQLTLVDAAFDDVIQQVQQDKIYQLTLQNEVKGLGQQTKTISQIYQEGEEAQK